MNVFGIFQAGGNSFRKINTMYKQRSILIYPYKVEPHLKKRTTEAFKVIHGARKVAWEYSVARGKIEKRKPDDVDFHPNLTLILNIEEYKVHILSKYLPKWM